MNLKLSYYTMNKNFTALKERFKVTLPLTKLEMIGSRLVTNDLIISDDILLDMQFVTFLLLSSIRALGIREKI